MKADISTLCLSPYPFHLFQQNNTFSIQSSSWSYAGLLLFAFTSPLPQSFPSPSTLFATTRQNLRKAIAKLAADLLTKYGSKNSRRTETENFDGGWRKDGTEGFNAFDTFVAGSIACCLCRELAFLQLGSGEQRGDLLHYAKEIVVDLERISRRCCRCRYSNRGCSEDESEVGCDLHFG